MANSRIKGITIDIDGDTSKLQKSLNAVNAPINKINKELSDLQKALKLDPKNTELLAQKQEVLKRNIAATTEKLGALIKAQQEMGDYNSLTDEQKEAYNRLSLEIAKSKNALKDMNEELKSSSKIDLTKLKDGLKKVGEVAKEVAKALAKVTAAIGGALVTVVTMGVKSYAELEKAQKGAERLFGKSFSIVEKNAAQAYKNLGISASQYYDQVNTYAVGLKNALNGDTKAAANLSNAILIAQADIVAATGADADAVSNAFAAVMRGNYTMLDNLRLGIKGSKEGMQEVIDKVNTWNKAHGKATHYQMGNYADMQKALVDYTKMVGVAGTSSKQMASTISGSVTQMKAAFDNFLNGSGGAEDLANTISNFLSNILSAISKLLPNLVTGLNSLIYNLTPIIGDLLWEQLPVLLKELGNLISFICVSIINDTGEISKTVKMLIDEIVKFITTYLPILFEAALKLVLELAKGIADAVKNPEFVRSIIWCLNEIVNILLDNIDIIVDVVIELALALSEAIIKALPMIISKLPEILKKLFDALVRNIPKIIQMFVTLLGMIWNNLWKPVIDIAIKVGSNFLSKIGEFFSQLPNKVWTWLQETFAKVTEWGANLWTKAVEIGTNFFNGVVDFFATLPERTGYYVGECFANIVNFGVDAYNWVITEVPKIIDSAIDFIKELPSKVWNWLVQTTVKVAVWVNDMKNKAITAGTTFVANIINFIKTLPSKIWEWFTKTVEKINKFKEDMTEKGKKAGKDFFDKLINEIKELPSKLAEIGGEIVKGLWQGISGGATWLGKRIKGFCDGVIKGFKDNLKIGSPSKLMRDEVGYWLAQGLGVGFTNEMEKLTDDMTNSIPVNQLANDVSSALRSLNAGIETSINPTINPTYENNYKMMAEIFKEVLGDMKVELDDREMGKFIDKTVANEVFS